MRCLLTADNAPSHVYCRSEAVPRLCVYPSCVFRVRLSLESLGFSWTWPWRYECRPWSALLCCLSHLCPARAPPQVNIRRTTSLKAADIDRVVLSSSGIQVLNRLYPECDWLRLKPRKHCAPIVAWAHHWQVISIMARIANLVGLFPTPGWRWDCNPTMRES